MSLCVSLCENGVNPEALAVLFPLSMMATDVLGGVTGIAEAGRLAKRFLNRCSTLPCLSCNSYPE